MGSPRTHNGLARTDADDVSFFADAIERKAGGTDETWTSGPIGVDWNVSGRGINAARFRVGAIGTNDSEFLCLMSR
jgi:hypothetical protein